MLPDRVRQHRGNHDLDAVGSGRGRPGDVVDDGHNIVAANVADSHPPDCAVGIRLQTETVVGAGAGREPIVFQPALRQLPKGWHGLKVAALARGIGANARIADAGLLLMRAASGFGQRQARVVAKGYALLAPGPLVDELQAEGGLVRAGAQLQAVTDFDLDGTPLALGAGDDTAYTELRRFFGTHPVQNHSGLGWTGLDTIGQFIYMLQCLK